MTKEEMAAAFNEWLREYSEEPERFEHTFETVGRFLSEKAEGREPSYGETCAAVMLRYHERLVAPDTSLPAA